ncbi:MULTISPECIES: FAD-dependent oxidoreductase [unclassified Brevibacterium]|uniref:FAD-dependent oxidoreductase n=1 Tax=unclassified Brevibacterium TaxID=2614124 RepID=UPI001E3B193B|nr:MULTISPECIES: FAD-dependent oxidoreductase [unclassified Brevibacterium]MDK8433294.1 FAD-dependent oxidoreductase [Brevibacterium sp. H-BE7]
MSISRVAVVGAGILGVAIARELTDRLPDAEVTVFDKADRVAAHQSGHTSGIVDSGLAEAAGSKEAKLARRGVELLVPFVSGRGIPYRECGQLLVAQTTDEADRLEELFTAAEKNEIPGVRLLERGELREIEPNARGVLGLYSPHTAVTDFAALTEALASDVIAAGGAFVFDTEVTGFDVMSNEVRLRGRSTSEVGGGQDHCAETGDGDGVSGVSGGKDEGTREDRDDDIDEQVHEVPRTYRGDDASGPVVDFGDELRSRFGGQDWFKQVEDTVENLTEKLSNTWSGRGGTSAPTDSPNRAEDSGRTVNGDRTEDSEHTERAGRAENSDHQERTLGTFDLVITCAGLQADRLAEAAGLSAEPRIVPFTSDVYIVDEADTEVVRGIVGSVPDPSAPFADAALVRGVNGSLMLGPNTFVAFGREKYEKRGFDLGDVGSTVKFKGFWKFAAQTAKTAARGARPVVSRSAFLERLQKFVPALDADSVAAGPRGVRAQAMSAEGELINEVREDKRGRLTMVRSIPRWGATSALAIAEDVVDRALEPRR